MTITQISQLNYDEHLKHYLEVQGNVLLNSVEKVVELNSLLPVKFSILKNLGDDYIKLYIFKENPVVINTGIVINEIRVNNYIQP